MDGLTTNGMEVFILLIYNLALLPLMAYNLGQLGLLVTYLRTGNQREAARLAIRPTPWRQLPHVTVQLPVYNERYVVERLIDAVAALNYPVDKLQIQVLDDSTDESVALIAKKVDQYQRQGLAIEHIRRAGRTGYKAGALAHGLALASGEFIAIFDADFVPDPDFLLKTTPHFANPAIGMVQTRWTHLNENYSLLTQLQGFGLDAHFFVEQSARNIAGLFMNFNGTAGIWRKTAIIDAGGWSNDTLTEDLDLSYRAQLRGWQFVYREDVGSPAELPVTMNAIKSQQYRWMKGAAECARKLLGSVLTATQTSVIQKVYGSFHLLSSSMFGLLLTTSVLSVPVLFIHAHHPDWRAGYWLINLFQFTLLVALFFYGVPFWRAAQDRARSRQAAPGLIRPINWFRFMWYFPLYAALMLGLAMHNTIAVVEGYLGHKTPFVRTPKFNVYVASDRWQDNVYSPQSVSWLTLLEGSMVLYFAGGISLGIYSHDHQMLPFHCLLVVGYGLVAGYSLAQSRLRRPASRQPVLPQPGELIETSA